MTDPLADRLAEWAEHTTLSAHGRRLVNEAVEALREADADMEKLAQENVRQAETTADLRAKVLALIEQDGEFLQGSTAYKALREAVECKHCLLCSCGCHGPNDAPIPDALTVAVREATLPCDGDLVYSGHGGHLEYMPAGPSCGDCPNCRLRKMVEQ